jgi:hypothetical protein
MKAALSRSKLDGMAPGIVHWDRDRGEGQGGTKDHFDSKPISLRILERHLENGEFNYESFNLFDPRCDWLDAQSHFATQSHYTDPDGESASFKYPTALGDSFPLIPALDREGQIFRSFQAHIEDHILTLHKSLVEKSNESHTLSWFQDLRSYASECVSMIDAMLHQLYFKAEYSPLPGWKFERDALGNRHGRRLSDKLGWVYRITGNDLNAKEELEVFDRIKALRNHLQHFDPPCLCFTLEIDVVGWLNAMPSVAMLAWKIRRCLRSPLSVRLIRMLLTPPVEFVPEYPDNLRSALGKGMGYASTCWKK